MKEANPAHGSIRSALVSAWERLESSIFVVHIRTATWGALTWSHWPGWILLPVMGVLGFLGGGVWGAVAGGLRARGWAALASGNRAEAPSLFSG